MSNHKYALNLEVSQWRRTYGDVEVFGTWLWTTHEPVLAFVPAIRRKGRAFVPSVIRLNNTWIYSEELGDPRAAAAEAYQIAIALGAEPDRATCMKILGIIRDCLSDLINMPPAPESMRRVAAEIIHTNRETGEQRHAEVLDDI